VRRHEMENISNQVLGYIALFIGVTKGTISNV